MTPYNVREGILYYAFVGRSKTGKVSDVCVNPFPDPIGLHADPLSSHELLVSWSVSGPAQFFQVSQCIIKIQLKPFRLRVASSKIL